MEQSLRRVIRFGEQTVEGAQRKFQLFLFSQHACRLQHGGDAERIPVGVKRAVDKWHRPQQPRGIQLLLRRRQQLQQWRAAVRFWLAAICSTGWLTQSTFFAGLWCISPRSPMS